MIGGCEGLACKYVKGFSDIKDRADIDKKNIEILQDNVRTLVTHSIADLKRFAESNGVKVEDLNAQALKEELDALKRNIEQCAMEMDLEMFDQGFMAERLRAMLGVG